MVNQYNVKRPVHTCECGEHIFFNMTRGFVGLASPEDSSLVSRNNWSTLLHPDGRPYGVRRENRTGKVFFLHREILQPASGVIVDHANGNGVDNRRSNIRECTQGQNLFNQRKRARRASTAYKGVYFDPTRQLYQAYVSRDGVRHHVGRFRTAEEAVSARDAAAKKLHGEFFRGSPGT